MTYEDGYPPAREFLHRHLPLGVRSGHDLLYGREATGFAPTHAQIHHCLHDYESLLQGLQPTSHEPAKALERIMAFDMMDANELVLAFLGHATLDFLAAVDRAAIAASISASLSVVDRVVPQFTGHDFYKRYVRIGQKVVAFT